MIQQLIDAIIVLLRKQLALDSPETRVIVGPVANPPANPRPLWVLTPGKFSVNKVFNYMEGVQPQLHQTKQTIQINTQTPKGPYPLDYPPSQGTVSGRTTDQTVQVLLEGGDFTVDYRQASIAFKTAPKGPVDLEYSFVGISAQREFQQELSIDVFAVDSVSAEKWTAVSLAMILTELDKLTADQRKQYIAGDYTTLSVIRHIQFADGQTVPLNNGLRTTLRFDIAGQLTFIKELYEGYGIITEVKQQVKLS